MPFDYLKPAPVSWRHVLPVVLVTAVAAVVAWLTPLVDDAYIYLDYVHSLSEAGNWGLTPDYFSDTATSPLHVLWLYVFAQLAGGNALVAVVLATAFLWVVGAWVLVNEYRDRIWLSTAFLLSLVMLPPVLSSVGMETTWLTVGIICSWVLLRKALRYDSTAMFAGFGASLALLFALRPDAALFTGALLVGTTFISRKFLWIATPVAAACTVLFLGLRWLLLGSVLPDSVFMKLNQAGDWDGKNLLNGWMLYWDSNPGAVVLFVAALVGIAYLGIFAVVRSPVKRITLLRTPSAVFAGAALVYFAGAVLAGVPPYHWYYVLPSVALLLVAFHIASTHKPRSGTAGFGALAAAGLALAIVGGMSGYPSLSTNWGSEAELKQIGQEIAPIVKGEDVDLDGEIGTIAYFCDCNLIDEFSVSQAQKEFYDSKVAAGGIKAKVLKANYAHRQWESAAPAKFLLTTVQPQDPTTVLYTKALTSALGVKHTYFLVTQVAAR